MTKLMITALLFCSSLSFAGEAPEAPTTAPQKKKPSKISKLEVASDNTALTGLGTTGVSTAAPKKAVMVRGTGTAPQK